MSLSHKKSEVDAKKKSNADWVKGKEKVSSLIAQLPPVGERVVADHI